MFEAGCVWNLVGGKCRHTALSLEAHPSVIRVSYTQATRLKDLAFTSRILQIDCEKKGGSECLGLQAWVSPVAV